MRPPGRDYMNTVICRAVATACFAFTALAQAQGTAALAGQVSSAEEGAMEGVVVSAKRDGSTISVSVVTDAQGRFAFPAARLEPGHYTLKARAAGFEIDGARAADVAAGSAASADLSQRETWAYPLKTEPRLAGKSTRVIITEYDLPNPLIQPHDVMLDRQGNAWYSDFGQMFLGKMDPKTGKVTQYPIPVVKQGWSEGTLDLEFDRDDNPWVGVMYQSAIAKFDRKSEKFRMWSTPKEWDTDAGQLGHIAIEGTHSDNKVWIKNSDGGHIYRLDLVSNKMENLAAFKDPQTGKRIRTYGIHSDAQNNAYLLDFAAGNIVRIDAKTRNAIVYPTPTPDSRPRRGRVDHEGRLWFAEYQGNAIGMSDPGTERIMEWKVPTPWSAPYDAVAGRNGEAWTGSMLTDRVSRLEIRSGGYTEYMLPRPTNIRRVYLDDSKSPGTLWIGSNPGASIVQVEPLD